MKKTQTFAVLFAFMFSFLLFSYSNETNGFGKPKLGNNNSVKIDSSITFEEPIDMSKIKPANKEKAKFEESKGSNYYVNTSNTSTQNYNSVGAGNIAQTNNDQINISNISSTDISKMLNKKSQSSYGNKTNVSVDINNIAKELKDNKLIDGYKNKTKKGKKTIGTYLNKLISKDKKSKKSINIKKAVRKQDIKLGETIDGIGFIKEVLVHNGGKKHCNSQFEEVGTYSNGFDYLNDREYENLVKGIVELEDKYKNDNEKTGQYYVNSISYISKLISTYNFGSNSKCNKLILSKLFDLQDFMILNSSNHIESVKDVSRKTNNKISENLIIHKLDNKYNMNGRKIDDLYTTQKIGSKKVKRYSELK